MIPTSVLHLLQSALQFYTYLIILRVVLTWFPNIAWYRQPWRTLALATDALLEPARRLIPPLGALDISPLVVMLALNLLQGLLRALA